MINIPATVYRDGAKRDLSPEELDLKRDMYERINPRRRKFIDRIGYDNWDPFPMPNDPMEMRMDVTKRTTQQLIREFLQSPPKDHERSNAYSQGALECALGIINRDDKYLGMFDFAIWYAELLHKEGHNERKV